MKPISHLPLALVTIAACALATAPNAKADLLNWVWDGQGAHPDGAGTPLSIESSFNTVTEVFSWTVTFDQLTDGLTLAVSPGPEPTGSNELAILYVNKYEEAAAYVYNGIGNETTSHLTLDGGPPVLLEDNIDTSWINNISVTNTGAVRTFDFEIDATAINLYGATQDPVLDEWTGIGFGQEVGVWMHWWDKAAVKFDDQTGTPTDQWGEKVRCLCPDPKEGFLDISHVPIPEPNSVLLLGIASSLLLARRRFRSHL